MDFDANKLIDQLVNNATFWFIFARTFGVSGAAFGARMQFRAVLYKFGITKAKVHKLSNNSIAVFNLILSILMAMLLNGLKLPVSKIEWVVWGIELLIYSSLALMVHGMFKQILIPIVEKKYKIKID